MRTAGSNPTHVVTLVYTTLGLVLFVFGAVQCASVEMWWMVKMTVFLHCECHLLHCFSYSVNVFFFCVRLV